MFSEFNKKIQHQFDVMCKTGNLFKVELEEGSISDLIWDKYIKSFKEGDDPIFRDPSSSTHNCNNDKNFIRRYGNVVSIIDNKVVTMWDLDLPEDNIYYNSCKEISKVLHNNSIHNVFIETFDWLNKANYEKTKSKGMRQYRLGVEKTFKQYTPEEVSKYGIVTSNKVYEFEHFHVYLPENFVSFSKNSIESILGDLRTTRQLFEKGLKIPLETLELVRDLIQQGSLLRGDMYLNKVQEFIKLKKEFEKISKNDQNNWMWKNFQKIPFARFSNELIGETCIELAEGKEINKVCRDFNQRVDPANYNKAKSPITKGMIEIAEKQISDLGYSESFERRFANIDDIDVSEIKHSNIDNTIEKPLGLFSKAGISTKEEFSRHKRAEFEKVEQVNIDKFMSEILPNITSMELFVENKHESNLVSLFTSANQSKNLFKWNNSFSWTYKGNLSGKSMIKENVKLAGGKTEGIVRCSLQWNDKDTKGILDFDLHCRQTHGSEIYYANKKCHKTGGWLDVDMIRPSNVGIENITWDKKIPDGNYTFFVRNFDGGRNNGFKVEIEFGGTIFNYHYKNNVSSDIQVATITVEKGNISIKHHLEETNSNKKIWNVETNQFHKVNLLCTSPNYWGDNNIGTKEYFFMLQDCKADEAMRSFHPDQLNSELMSVRKAIDLLGNYKMVEPSNKQLSGLGFNSTVRDEIIVKLKGTHQRVIKIIF